MIKFSQVKRQLANLQIIFTVVLGNIPWLYSQDIPLDSVFMNQSDSSFLLNELIVKSAVPLFSRKGNNLVVHVSNTPLSSVGTAQEVIQRIPGVSIKEEAVTVFSKGTPVIYINNRKLYDESELQRLQSSDIATIELITNPGAKYDAEGRAVLIIKTKPNEANGWAFQVSERLKQGDYFGDKEDFGLTYNHAGFSLFTGYHHDADKSYYKPDVAYTIHSDTLWRQLLDAPQTHWDYANQLTAGMDWSVTEKQAVGAQYQGMFDNGKVTSPTTEDVWADNILYDKVISLCHLKQKSYQHLVNAFYRYDYSESFNWQIDADYVNARDRTDQRVVETSFIENRDARMESQSKYNLYAGKITFNYRLNENSALEFGTEYNQIKGSGHSINPEQYVNNSIYTHEEEKTAGFITYTNRFGKLHFQLGIRYERAHLKATEDSIRQVKTDRKYEGFYPSLMLSQPVGNTGMSLELSRKTQRPPFSLLSSTNTYVNRFLFEKGNPYLQNEDIYQADYHLTYKMLDVTLGYAYKKNPIEITMDNVENNSSRHFMTYINYPEYQELNALFTANFEWKIWKPRLTAGLNQPFFTVDYLEKKINRNQTGLLLQFFNDIVFPKEYIFSANFEYLGKHNEYITEKAGNKRLDLGLRKSFLDKKLTFQLQVNDVFKWITSKAIININTISYIRETQRETRFVTLTVNYRFNNYKKKYRGENAAGEDLKRL
ncbi:MAG: outer membrane beta-barrel family protein [Candidatus Symbiothrix sp.]|jgi:hypothetical protein|nr:outer membrane beta-barrel family protein [Candidatus Symbiothrix sp.]